MLNYLIWLKNNKVFKLHQQEKEVDRKAWANKWAIVNKVGPRSGRSNVMPPELNSTIVGLPIEELITFSNPHGSGSYAMPMSELLDDFYNSLISWLKANTYYNEGKERIWLKDPSHAYLKFSYDMIVGIVLPGILKANYEGNLDEAEVILDMHQQRALGDIKQKAEANSWKIYWHDAFTASHMIKLGKLHGIKDHGTKKIKTDNAEEALTAEIQDFSEALIQEFLID